MLMKLKIYLELKYSVYKFQMILKSADTIKMYLKFLIDNQLFL